MYFFDADDLGENARLEKVKEEISLDNNMTNGEIYKNLLKILRNMKVNSGLSILIRI